MAIIISFNPRYIVISSRLLATPISGKGEIPLPLEISGSNGPIFKIQTAFNLSQHDLPVNFFQSYWGLIDKRLVNDIFWQQ